MTAILTDEDGRRCDAACHDAKRALCECICRGEFHSLGYEAAVAKLEAEAEEWEQEFEINLDPPKRVSVTLEDLFAR